jgi:hypothetical protein
MSQSCPLCGNNKPEEALFCDDCAKKIRMDYELELPENITSVVHDPENSFNGNRTENAVESVEPLKSPEPDRVSEPEETVGLEENVVEPLKGVEQVEESVEPGEQEKSPETLKSENPKEEVVEPEEISKPEEVVEPEETVMTGELEKTIDAKIKENSDNRSRQKMSVAPRENYQEEMPGELTDKKKGKSSVATILLAATLIVGSFFIYNQTVKKSYIDGKSWEAALNKNTVEGYLFYMESYPHGKHFNEAQNNLLSLKSEEAADWEQIKFTGNISELHNFLDQHPGSPYTLLAEIRIDSLSWMGALRTNTPESYSGYITLSQNGEIRGEYIAEALKRDKMLSPQYPQNEALSDSIFAIVNGFYSSLSAVDHNKMSLYLAPVVKRFFNSGTATREKITGELLVAGAQSQGSTLKFTPNTEAVNYEKTTEGYYKINVPLMKSYVKNENIELVPGYIVHMELNPGFQIISIHETKPYPGAP